MTTTQYGQNKCLPHKCLLSTPHRVDKMDDYFKCQLRAFQNFHLIHGRLTSSQNEMSKQHFRSSASFLEIGDIVFHQQHYHHSKLDPIFHRPHRIPESLHGHKFEILDLKSFVQCVSHGDRLKKVDKGMDELLLSSLPVPTSSGSRSLTFDTHCSFRHKLSVYKS